MAQRWIVQFCHGYSGPFLDVARQYAALFAGSGYRVLTVYLTGKPSAAVETGSASDEVVFFDFSSREVRALKFAAIRKFARLTASRDVALVIAHRFKPIYVACLATRLPVIGVHHAFGDYDRAPRRWFAAAMRRRLALIGVSDAVRDDIRKRLPDWPRERIETLHNRLDLEAASAMIVARSEARSTLGLPQDAIVVANVGRLHPDKDQATLLAGFAAALPALPAQTLLVIAGRGPLEAQLHELASQLGLGERVRFLGQVPDVRRFFAAFDLFVLSSDHEPFGMVLLEAMAASVPVIATDCGGAPEVVGSKELLFGWRDADALAALMRRLLAETDGASRRAIGERGAQRLDTLFSDEVGRQRFFALPLVQDMLGARPR